MRFAIISDIHANWEALTAVLEEIDNAKVDQTICLGDLVGYYANPNECLQIIRQRKMTCIAGNHDRVAAGIKEPTWFGPAAKQAIYWTRKHLTEDNRRFLERLPITEFIDHRFLVVHASLTPEPNEDIYVNSKDVLRDCFKRLIQFSPALNVCFFGHTHRSVAYESKGGVISMLESPKVRLDRNAHYLINPGSVGQSRDHDPRAAFLIFDSEEETIEFRRVAYDVTSCWRKAAEAGLLYRQGLLSRLDNWVETCKDVLTFRRVT